MNDLREPGRVTIARLQRISRARLDRQLGLVRDDLIGACDIRPIARRHPFLLVAGTCAGSAIATWWLTSMRRRTVSHAPVPALPTHGSWAEAVWTAVSAIYRMWSHSRL